MCQGMVAPVIHMPLAGNSATATGTVTCERKEASRARRGGQQRCCRSRRGDACRVVNAGAQKVASGMQAPAKTMPTLAALGMADLLVQSASSPTALLPAEGVPLQDSAGVARVPRVASEQNGCDESVRVRRVGFDLAVVVHEIQPYAEIYGLHPREFVFGRGFYMIPATHSVFCPEPAALHTADDEDDEAEESDEEEF